MLPTGPGDRRSEHWFRQLTPLVLLITGFVALFEPQCRKFVPGQQWFTEQLGDTWLLRLCLALLVFYVLLLWGESLRLHHGLTALLGAFKEAMQKAGGKQAGAAARLEAITVLVAALRSGDAKVQATSRQNLVRIAGRDLGDDPAAWLEWLEAEAKKPPPPTGGS